MSNPTAGGRRFAQDPIADAIPETVVAPVGGQTAPDGLSSARRVQVGDRQLFNLSLWWTVVGTVFPGTGLIRAGRRLFGSLVFVGALLTGVIGVGMWFLSRRQLIGFAVNPQALLYVGAAAIIVGLLWVFTIGVTHLTLRPANPTKAQRATGAVVVAFLSFAVAAPSSVSARMAYDQSQFVSSVFKETKSVTVPKVNVVDPWRDKPRLNVLLLGGDSGRNRNEEYGDRTDTVIVASIDTQTGQAVTFSLPRNTSAVPFPKDTPMYKKWPRGYTNGNPNDAGYFLNSIYNGVPKRLPKGALGETDNPGADVLKLAVGEALGLSIDYYLLINLDGFTDLVDALGGITLNVNERIPIGGDKARNKAPDGWLDPGPNQHLDGQRALWYARSRYNADDYARMDRQRCVVNAVLKQANPANVVTNYESILRAGAHSVRTDIPQNMLSALIELGLKAKSTPMKSIVFKHGSEGFYSTHPNWPMIRKRVAEATSTPGQTPTPVSTSQASTGATTTAPATPPLASPVASASADGGALTADDACAFRPKK